MTPEAVSALLDATWPAAAFHRHAGWCIREGAGGGRRVSAATAEAQDADIATAEARMRALGQAPLFMLRAGEGALDAALAARGYGVEAETGILTAPAARVAEPRPRGRRVYPVWPPLAVQADLWAAGGIGPARCAVMARAAGPRTALLARRNDRVAGAAFVVLSGRTAMLHALQVPAPLRREGVARDILRAAAAWAEAQGGETLAVAVERANAPARALFEGCGMTAAAAYHYRA